MKYRDRMEIFAMILQIAAQGVTKTKIMYAAYLSFQQVSEYLEFLQENDLLQYEKETEHYRVTEKGFRFLKVSNEMNALFSFKNSKFDDSFGL